MNYKYNIRHHTIKGGGTHIPVIYSSLKLVKKKTTIVKKSQLAVFQQFKKA